jgi:hypothetical protein
MSLSRENRFVRVEQEEGEEAPLLLAPERHDPALVHDLEWPEDVELHSLLALL